MKSTIVGLIVFCIFYTTDCLSQQQWKNWNASNSSLPTNQVNALTVDSSNNVWLATNAGVAKFNGVSWTIYNSSNSPLPHNVCYAIASEGNTIWIGSVWGLVRFDGGTNWMVYTTANSSLPYDYIISIDIDSSGNKWICTIDQFGTTAGGVTKFDNVNWITYNTSNSGIIYNWAPNTFVDRTNVKWIGTAFGLSVFDDTNWNTLTPSNSSLPDIAIEKVREDLIDSLYWIGTDSGLALLNTSSNHWTIYNTSNFLHDNVIGDIEIDAQNRKWISTYRGGIAMFDNSTWTFYDTSNVGEMLRFVRNLCFDHRGGLWATSQLGLIYYGDTLLLTGVSIMSIAKEIQCEVFPTPANQFLNVVFHEQTMTPSILIYDVASRLVYQREYAFVDQGEMKKFDVSDLLNGEYIVEIHNDRQRHFQKIIINH